MDHDGSLAKANFRSVNPPKALPLDRGEAGAYTSYFATACTVSANLLLLKTLPRFGGLMMAAAAFTRVRFFVSENVGVSNPQPSRIIRGQGDCKFFDLF